MNELYQVSTTDHSSQLLVSPRKGKELPADKTEGSSNYAYLGHLRQLRTECCVAFKGHQTMIEKQSQDFMGCFSTFGEIQHHYTVERTDKLLFPSEIILQSGGAFPFYELLFKERTVLFLIPAISNSRCYVQKVTVSSFYDPFLLGHF